METINFDRDKLKRLKDEYRKAVERGDASFLFEGHELLTSYVKYLIQFLTDRFKYEKR